MSHTTYTVHFVVFCVNRVHLIDRCYENTVARDLPLLVAMEIVDAALLCYAESQPKANQT